MKTAGVVAAVLIVAAAAFAIQIRRANLSVGDVISGPAPFDLDAALASGRAVTRGPRIDFLERRALGEPVKPDDRPLVANVQIADLDRDGLADVLVADAAANRVTGCGRRRRDCSPNRRSPRFQDRRTSAPSISTAIRTWMCSSPAWACCSPTTSASAR